MDPIVQPGPLPLAVSIPGGMNPNRFIVIDGKVPSNAVGVRLQNKPQLHGGNEIAMDVTFKFLQKNAYFSVNSMLQNKWGPPEGSLKEDQFYESQIQQSNVTATTGEGKESVVPLQPDDYCGILLECRENCFSISVKSKHIWDFPHRTDYTKIAYLVLTGDFIAVQAGVMGGQGPTKWLIYATGLYEPWKQNSIAVLTDLTFEPAVVKSREMWLIAFYLNNCSFHNEFENAAEELMDRNYSINFGVMDCLVNLDTASRLKIERCPVVLSYDEGYKTWDSAQKYDGDHSALGFMEWATHKLDNLSGDLPRDGTPIPKKKAIRKIYKESWEKGPLKPLDGAEFPPGLDLDETKLADKSSTSASKFGLFAKDPMSRRRQIIEEKLKAIAENQAILISQSNRTTATNLSPEDEKSAAPQRTESRELDSLEVIKPSRTFLKRDLSAITPQVQEETGIKAKLKKLREKKCVLL